MNNIMLEKLEKAFNEMKATEKASIQFDVAEISILIALIKGNDTYEKVLMDNMFKTFEK